MKTKAFLVGLLVVLFLGGAVNAQEVFVSPLNKVFVQTKRVDWKTYEFSTRSNVENNVNLQYSWTVDGDKTFFTPTLKYVFPTGKHIVSLKVTDKYGNVANDTVKVEASFWVITNPWLWLSLYLVVVAFILYYWLFKIIYLTVRQKFHREAKIFLDAIFDEKGLVSKLIELEARKIKNQKAKIKNFDI
jgi:hypothetical protein